MTSEEVEQLIGEAYTRITGRRCVAEYFVVLKNHCRGWYHVHIFDTEGAIWFYEVYWKEI